MARPLFYLILFKIKPYIESSGVWYPVYSHILIVFCVFLSFSAVHGSSQAASDASETSAGPDLPAPRSSQEGPPLHLHPDPLLGSTMDPQVHRGCHHISCHGKTRVLRKTLLIKNTTAVSTFADMKLMWSCSGFFFPDPGSGGG